MTPIERLKFMNHALFYLHSQMNNCEQNRDGIFTQTGMLQLQALRDAQSIIRAAK